MGEVILLFCISLNSINNKCQALLILVAFKRVQGKLVKNCASDQMFENP